MSAQIQRYEPGWNITEMTPDGSGEWMRHADHLRDREALVKEIDRLKAELSNIPLCADHAQLWFTARHINPGECWGCDIEKELDSLRAKLAEVEAELESSEVIAEGQIASERLGGNVVKEEFWKGELAVIRRLRSALANETPNKGNNNVTP